MAKVYSVKEVFPTIQGEGFWTGRAATFVRFSGCNLWSGREEDRQSAVCRFCDTQFVGGVKYTMAELLGVIGSYRPRFVVFTGGEPALQLDADLVRALQRRGFSCAIETNGTLSVPSMLDWICVSPKAGTEIVIQHADEMKLVYPQEGLPPWWARGLVATKHLWLSPMDGPDLVENTRLAVEYVSQDNRWRLNMQSHKVWGIK